MEFCNWETVYLKHNGGIIYLLSACKVHFPDVLDLQNVASWYCCKACHEAYLLVTVENVKIQLLEYSEKKRVLIVLCIYI